MPIRSIHRFAHLLSTIHKKNWSFFGRISSDKHDGSKRQAASGKPTTHKKIIYLVVDASTIPGARTPKNAQSDTKNARYKQATLDEQVHPGKTRERATSKPPANLPRPPLQEDARPGYQGRSPAVMFLPPHPLHFSHFLTPFLSGALPRLTDSPPSTSTQYRPSVGQATRPSIEQKSENKQSHPLLSRPTLCWLSTLCWFSSENRVHPRQPDRHVVLWGAGKET